VGEETLVIHVCDENRMINRDFKVNKTLLLSHMKYFTTYLSGSDAFDDIDISVHCDVHIFDWLVKYVHNQSKPPALGNVFLLSSCSVSFPLSFSQFSAFRCFRLFPVLLASSPPLVFGFAASVTLLKGFCPLLSL
jgi:hypothetical protein